MALIEKIILHDDTNFITIGKRIVNQYINKKTMYYNYSDTIFAKRNVSAAYLNYLCLFN